jgi:hypothetical protein
MSSTPKKQFRLEKWNNERLTCDLQKSEAMNALTGKRDKTEEKILLQGK